MKNNELKTKCPEFAKKKDEVRGLRAGMRFDNEINAEIIKSEGALSAIDIGWVKQIKGEYKTAKKDLNNHREHCPVCREN
jgi:hypothetical protein